MKQLPATILFAIAFAFVEAAVVEYLRAVYYPLSSGGFHFPTLTVELIRQMGPEHYRRLFIELGREVSTLVMLAAWGMGVGRNIRESWAHFVIAFGVWDLFYYIWLKLFIDWPVGFFDWDLLFLLPVPWTAPVIAPVIVSLIMIGAGISVLYHEGAGRPLQPKPQDWAVLVLGGLIVITAFCWDYADIMAGGFPKPFNWPLFVLGVLVGVGAFARIVYLSKHPKILKI